jgi:putative MFS transporter
MAGAPLTSYQRRLIFFLSVATFFEGYDYFALAQILPNLQTAFGLNEAEGGWLVAVINFGTVLAAILVRRADAWGRRRVLTVTIIGYTLASLASAASPNVIVFGGLQLVARVFLIGEWATAMVYAAEEFPADRRGMVIGLIQGCASLGTIACAGVVPALLKTSLGWRTVYLVGAVPLLVVAVLRRGLKETARFAAGKQHAQRPLSEILRGPYRKRVLQLSLVWGVTYLATTNAIIFWKVFAINERGFTDGQVGMALTIASVASMPLVFFAGKLLDLIGRRLGAVIIFVTTALGTFLGYTLHSHAGLIVALVLGIFGVSSVLPVMNAYTTELFPTELRGDAFAWSNNLLGRITYVLSPIGIGFAAQAVGWGPTIAATSVFALVALALIWRMLPETNGRELEETSAIA